MATLNTLDIQFASEYPIDKIAAYSSLSDVYPASVPANISYSITGSGTSSPSYTLKSIANPYGKRCLPSLTWSLDGTNWYDQDDVLIDTSTLFIKMQVSCGCSDSTIYFFFVSSFAGTQTVNIQFAVDSPT